MPCYMYAAHHCTAHILCLLRHVQLPLLICVCCPGNPDIDVCVCACMLYATLQRLDWPLHKMECKIVRGVKEVAPAPFIRLAL